MTTRAAIPATSLREAALRRADAQMVAAKHAFSVACLASSRGAHDAVALTRRALALVEAARAEIARLNDQDIDGTGPAT